MPGWRRSVRTAPRDMHCYAENDSDLFLYEDPAYYTTNNLGLALTRINTVDVGKGSMMDYSKCGTVL
jgi:hypothetical protein